MREKKSEAYKWRRRQNISTVITSGRSNLVERIMAAGRRGDKQKENTRGGKEVEGHCERRRKATVWSERNEEQDSTDGFSVSVKRTKRISGSANVRVGRRRRTEWQRKANEGKGTTLGGKGREGRKREEVGSLAPPRPCETSTKRDPRGTYAISQSSASRASSALGLRRESADLAWVSRSLTLYYYTPYTAVYHTSRWVLVLPRIRT